MLALQRKRTARRLSPQREYREVNRLRSGLERTFTFRLIRLFSDIGNQAAEAVEAGNVSAVRGLYPDIRRGVEATLGQLYEETIKIFSDRAIANRRSAKAIASFEDLFTTYLRTQGAERVRDISLTTQKLLQRVVEDNSTAGTAAIARAIRERFQPQFSRARASTIARTEIHNASAYATHEQQRSFGVPDMRKQWIANVDGRTRGTHAAVSGTQVDIDEDFTVGGRKMSYPGDPRGGPAEVINCRCVLIYIEPEEIVEETPPVVEAANPKRRPKRVGIDEIQILAKAVAVDRMEERFRAAQSISSERVADPSDALLSIAKLSKFRGRSADDYGRAKAGTLSKEATSIANALLEETDQLAAITGVIPLRGLKGISGNDALADMGDAVIGIKGKSFNAAAEKAVKGKVGDADIPAIQSKIKTLEADEAQLLKSGEEMFGDWDIAFERYILGQQGKPGGLSASDRDAYKEWRNSLKALRSALGQERNRLQAVSVQPADSWKWGDEISSRPWTSDAYFSDPLDKMRTTIYHEFGHNVHQQYRVNGWDSYFKPEVEEWLKSRATRDVRKSATRYGDKNEREWFAENFSLYFMDREDLVDPLFVRLIEAIINKRDLPDA